MRSKTLYFLILISVFNCKTDSFSNTEKSFLTDKDVYKAGENFQLTVLISSVKEEKTIRFYKTFSNLTIYFSLINHQKGIQSENNIQLKKYFIEGQSIFGSDERYINDYEISKSEPFEKTFIGRIFELKNEIVFEIPELKVKKNFDKTEFDEFSEISIQGYCEAINAGNGISEDFFEPKNIKIIID